MAYRMRINVVLILAKWNRLTGRQTGTSKYQDACASKNTIFALKRQIMYYIMKSQDTILCLENLNMYYLAPISHILFGQRWSVAPLIISYWSERSVCAALGCWHKRRWPL